MHCKKCKAELDEDAVFCDKCGSFVMREESFDTDLLETVGKRKRNRSAFWLFFRIISVAVIIIAGIVAVIYGYMSIANDRYGFLKVKTVSEYKEVYNGAYQRKGEKTCQKREIFCENIRRF